MTTVLIAEDSRERFSKFQPHALGGKPRVVEIVNMFRKPETTLSATRMLQHIGAIGNVVQGIEKRAALATTLGSAASQLNS